MNCCMLKPVVAAFAGAVIVGCTTPTTRIDTRNDLGPEVAGYDYRDVQETARVLLESLYRSGRLDRADGGSYVMTMGAVRNDTMQRFDTDTLTAYITESLMESGKVMMTSAMGATVSSRDEMVRGARSVRGDAEFNQATVSAQGQLVAPTHSISGKIVQRELRMDNGDKQVEYYFQLRITEIATGLQWWQKQHLIGKRTDGMTPTW